LGEFAVSAAHPGSHDSGTYGSFREILDEYARTQHKTIKEQLEMGIRFFDLRPLVDDGRYGLPDRRNQSEFGGGSMSMTDGLPFVTVPRSS
jgi:hypothetical protein